MKMGHEMTLPIILQLLGVGVVIAEIILPSGGILSILAAGMIGYSIYMVFAEISTTAGLVLLAADAVLLPILIVIGLKLLARSPATLRKRLAREDGVTSQSPELAAYEGCAGLTLTNLRPSGIALVKDKRLDVVTRGEFVEKNTPVVVVSVEGNRVVVQSQNEDEEVIQ